MLFAVCSIKGVTRLSCSLRAIVILPDEVKQVLIGILLGDAHLGGIVVRRLVLFVYYYYICFIYFYKIYINFANLKVIYRNPKTEKATILKENKGKSGIYLWTNKINGKRYVGSGVDLNNRFINYFNLSYLTDRKDTMIIYKAY